jgi:hypothetical protein
MREITFAVDGYPPAKNEAKSMLAAGHMYADRVVTLLRAAQASVGDVAQPVFPRERLGLEVVLTVPADPPGDATNYIGGIGDALEAKTRRGALDHLGDLAAVSLYENDRQIQEVHYRCELGDQPRYTVWIWVLD